MSESLGDYYCMGHIYLVVQVTLVTAAAWNGMMVSVVGIVGDMGQMSIEYSMVRRGKIELQQQAEWNFEVVLRSYLFPPQFVSALTLLLILLLTNDTFYSMI